MAENHLEDAVRQHLDVLYQQRAQKLERLKLRDLLKKNPFLYQLIETVETGEILKRLIENYLASSESWWNELTHDPKFCLSASRQRRDYPHSRWQYEEELARAMNRLRLQLINEFCNVDYRLDWEKLLLVNSAG